MRLLPYPSVQAEQPFEICEAVLGVRNQNLGGIQILAHPGPLAQAPDFLSMGCGGDRSRTVLEPRGGLIQSFAQCIKITQQGCNCWVSIIGSGHQGLAYLQRW
jgi:hypothetical protein